MIELQPNGEWIDLIHYHSEGVTVLARFNRSLPVEVIDKLVDTIRQSMGL